MKNNDTPKELKEKNEGSGFATGLFMGAVVGVGAMFLYGTKRGKKIRKSFEKELEKTGKEVQQKGKEAKKTLVEAVDKAEEIIEKAKVEANLAAKEAKEKAAEAQKAATNAAKKADKVKRFFKSKGKPLKKSS